MLSGFTISKIEQEPRAVNDIIYYYEDVLGFEFTSTDKISEVIEDTFINKCVIYKSDINNEKDFVEYFNDQYGTHFNSIEEIQEQPNIELINGDIIYAII